MRSRSITGGELLCTRYNYFDSGKSSVSLRGTACADPWSARTMAPRARNAPVETEGGCEVLKVCADRDVALPEDDPTWALKQIDYIGEGAT